jgi:dienelactone hydrolase
MGLPPFFLDHLALVKVPAYMDAPAVASPGSAGFPLLLFSHGWKGFNAQNTGQALLLASRGYVVVAVQHTYGAIVTVFPDGGVAKNNPTALPDGAPMDEYEVAARKLVGQWAEDLSFALTWMEERSADPGHPFSGLVDASRVGAFGHSTGGGAVIQFAATDPRCKAVLGMDPFMRPVSLAALDGGFPQPAFFMFSQKWTDDTKSRNNELFARFIPRATGSLGSIAIKGTDHFDFSDLPLLSPLAPWMGLKGPLAGKRVTVIVEDYLLSFFDLTLRGRPTMLLTGASPYPEVRKR